MGSQTLSSIADLLDHQLPLLFRNIGGARKKEKRGGRAVTGPGAAKQ